MTLLGLKGSEYSVKLPYSKVNNEKVTLSFKPASQVDEDTLLAFIGDTNASDANATLPDSIPAGLINLTAELKLNGEVIKSGLSVALGDEVQLSSTIQRAGGKNLHKKTHIVPAGSFVSLNTISQSISVKKLQSLQAKLNTTQDKLSSDDITQLSTLNKEDILGDMMYSGSLSYYAKLQAHDTMLNQAQKTFSTLIGGEGIFSYQPKVSYIFGIPQTIKSGAIVLDIPIGSINAIADNNHTKHRNYQRADMYASALEHLVPEQMFSTPTYKVDGFSTAKAFQKANESGQKIFFITKDNMNEILPQLNHTNSTINAITDALNAGKEVTVHQNIITLQGYSGTGYRIFDPITGDSADMISGGLNGGFAKFLTDALSVAIALLLGAIDGKIGLHLDKNYIFSKKLKDIAKLAKISQILGALGLGLSTYLIANDNNLSFEQKVGQISLQLMAYFLSSMLITLLPGGIFAAIMGMIIGIIVTIIATTLVQVLYTQHNFRLKVLYA